MYLSSRKRRGDSEGWGFVVLLLIGIGIYFAVNKDKPNGGNPFSSPGPSAPAAPPPVSRVNVTWHDGTTELVQLVAGLPDEAKLALGMRALFTGDDAYAAKVRISNTGTAPVSVSPDNIQIIFGQQYTKPQQGTLPQILRPCVLQPGTSTEGLVIIVVPFPLGVQFRSGGARLAYNDAAIEVTYNP